MKERPVLFSAPMVRALLAGTKTQTRRVLKPGGYKLPESDGYVYNGASLVRTDAFGTSIYPLPVCPHGEPGDRLWVRETWHHTGDHIACENVGFGHEHVGPCYEYAADFDDETRAQNAWRPSLFMPRRASRITLEVTSVRIERLDAITEEDARAEGVTPFKHDPEGDCWTARRDVHRSAFEYLWGEINGWTGPKAFAENPWVWVVAFRRLSTGRRGEGSQGGRTELCRLGSPAEAARRGAPENK